MKYLITLFILFSTFISIAQDDDIKSEKKKFHKQYRKSVKREKNVSKQYHVSAGRTHKKSINRTKPQYLESARPVRYNRKQPATAGKKTNRTHSSRMSSNRLPARKATSTCKSGKFAYKRTALKATAKKDYKKTAYKKAQDDVK